MTPKEKRWLASATDPATLRRKMGQHRLLIGVLAAGVVCSVLFISFGNVSRGWWALPVLLSVQIIGNLFNLREASRLLQAAEKLEQEENR